ncbi:hypothetical protein AB838_03045 [Rhodobacteraceae bacterium (ex Bugula neritina AB1)]|nr:hypothetical protein AB838_03045 [Rhodobacteraceae bacterium (ex Bugula neritina AB1)]
MKSSYLDDAEDHLTTLGAENGTKVANGGEILILVRGMTLHNDVPICMLSKPMAFNQDVKSLSPKNIDSRFLFHALKAAKPELLRRVDAAGHGTGRLGAEQIKSLPIPRFGHQQELDIAATLGALDDKIEVNRKTAATLEEMARALYRSWFVDFDPVHAKAAGRAPAHMNAATAALFPDSFGEDGLPEGWEIVSADQELNISIGKTPPRKQPQHFTSSNEGVPWLSIKDMGACGVFTGPTSEGLTDEAVKGFRVAIAPAGTVLLSFKLTVGRVCIASQDICTNEAIAHMKPQADSAFGSAFLFCALKGYDYDSLASTSSIATAVNSKTIKAMPLVRPTEALTRAFEAEAAPWMDKVALLAKENQTIANLRDTLLPRLMSGEMRVGEAKEQVEAVA